MTPREKALELLKKMAATPNYFWDKNDTDAMVAVDEVIDCLSGGSEGIEFWIEVKRELENI